MKKPKVALQFITELLVIALFATILGTGIAATASVPVANELLENQVTSQEASNLEQREEFRRPTAGGLRNIQISTPGSSAEETSYLDTINATISFSTIGKLLLIGIILTIVASLVALIFIMRYEPLKILSERT